MGLVDFAVFREDNINKVTESDAADAMTRTT
jgi:hypothetical protein